MTHHIATADRTTWAKTMDSIKIALYQQNPAYKGKRIADVIDQIDEEFNNLPMTKAMQLIGQITVH